MRRLGTSLYRVQYIESLHTPSLFERLEDRTLLSGWSTGWSFSMPQGEYADVQGAVSDAAGNVYVAGAADDAAGVQHDIVRMKAAGGTTWSTLSDEVRAEDYGDLAVNSAGDL